MTTDSSIRDTEKLEEEMLVVWLSRPEVLQDTEIIALLASLEHATAALKMTDVLTAAISNVAELVKSKHTSDVVEAVRFFKRAVHFDIKNSSTYLQG